jgi:hypothetical protein
MIVVASPSMAINDSRSPVSYTMDTTRTVQPATTIRSIVDMVLEEAKRVGSIQNLVLNGHASPGDVQIGSGLSFGTMLPFSAVRGKVLKIWLRGCLVARIIGPETEHDGDAAVLKALKITGDGHAFVSSFARLTGCYVVVPTEIQISRHRSYHKGLMDAYEGLVLSYDPCGNINWQRRYPSAHHHSRDGHRSRLPSGNRE